LTIEPGLGAGGLAVVTKRPVRVDRYRTNRGITHHYVGEIVREGIQSLAATPIIVRGRARGVLYGALRTSTHLGDRSLALLESFAGRLSRELGAYEEVDFRLRVLDGELDGRSGQRSLRESEVLAETYLQLRDIAAEVSDPGLRQRIADVEKLLKSVEGPIEGSAIQLTSREIDVLLCASVGYSNAEAARRLGLSPDTVKTYMRNLMAKLSVKTRHAAVVQARRHGLIP
ncbi:LuxR C-terminal-related transcriptional regulator, partial [Dietzia cinnamea]